MVKANLQSNFSELLKPSLLCTHCALTVHLLCTCCAVMAQ